MMVRVRERAGRLGAILVALLALAACATPSGPGGVAGPTTAHYKVGQPYQVNGRWYYPREQPDYDEVGVASWYGDEFHGRPTANGERFDKDRLSAAHTTLPLPSIVEIENVENGRRAVIRVNDRGPFIEGRMIDVSHAAARALGFEQAGLARVRVRYLGRAELAALAPRPGEGGRRERRPRPRDGDPAPVIVARAPEPPLSEPIPAVVDPSIRLSDQPDVIAEIIGGAPAPRAEGPRDPATVLPEAVTSAPLPPVAATGPSTPAADGPRNRAVPGEAASGEVWVEVARYYDLADLEQAQLALAGMGSARVQSTTSAGGAPVYLLELGPFSDIFAAEARLAALREAGYFAARIAGGP